MRHILLSKVQNHPWSKPLGIALKVTGEMCSLAGDAGVPVIGAFFYYECESSQRCVGLLGAGLKLGGDLLSEGGNECASMRWHIFTKYCLLAINL